MRWNSQEIDQYKQSKQYVDTVVLPLYPISFEEDMKQAAIMSEFIQLLTMQLEKQLKGRLLLLPGFIYLNNQNSKNQLVLLHQWDQLLTDEHFKHLFYVTSDSYWKSLESKLAGKLIWLPSLPLENLEEHIKTSLIEEQVKQLLQLFFLKWKETD